MFHEKDLNVLIPERLQATLMFELCVSGGDGKKKEVKTCADVQSCPPDSQFTKLICHCLCLARGRHWILFLENTSCLVEPSVHEPWEELNEFWSKRFLLNEMTSWCPSATLCCNVFQHKRKVEVSFNSSFHGRWFPRSWDRLQWKWATKIYPSHWKVSIDFCCWRIVWRVSPVCCLLHGRRSSSETHRWVTAITCVQATRTHVPCTPALSSRWVITAQTFPAFVYKNYQISPRGPTKFFDNQQSLIVVGLWSNINLWYAAVIAIAESINFISI